MRDLDSTNVEAAAYLAREADAPWVDRPSPAEYIDAGDCPATREAVWDVEENFGEPHCPLCGLVAESHRSER